MNKILITIVCISLMILLSSCFVPLITYDGTHRGRIIDSDTREPLEGVVVLGVWYTETPSPGGGVQHYYDAQEAVTDKNGDFSIPGRGIKVLTNLLPMQPIIYKAGYAYLQFYWDKESLNHKSACGAKVTWDGKIPVIPLKKLTPEEKQHPKSMFSDFPGPPNDAPYEKVKFLLKEINKDSMERRGFKLFPEWGGVKL